MFAKLKRLGSERVKFSLQCNISNVTLTDKIDGLQLLLVEFDRNGKTIRTPAKPPSIDGKTAAIDSVLNLSMTLWRDKNGFQSKVGVLILKACTKNAYGLVSTVVGTIELPLHELALSVIPSSTKVFWFKNNKGKQVGMLEVSFHAKQLANGASDASSECSDTSSQASWNCMPKKEAADAAYIKPTPTVTTETTTKSRNTDTATTKKADVPAAARKVDLAGGGPAPAAAVSSSRPAVKFAFQPGGNGSGSNGKKADNPFDGKDDEDSIDGINPFDDDESLNQSRNPPVPVSGRPINKSTAKSVIGVAGAPKTAAAPPPPHAVVEDDHSLQLELRDAYQHIEDLQVQVDKLVQQVSSEKELRRKAQAQGEVAERHLQRVTADLATASAAAAAVAATKTDQAESSVLIASLRTENQNLQDALQEAQIVLSKESMLLSSSSSSNKSSVSGAEKALRAENKNLQSALEEAQKDLDEFLSLFNSEKERFSTEMSMMIDHEQQLLKENKRLDMAVERLNDREASAALSSQRTGSGRGGNDNSSGRDSRSDGSDGISSSEHRRIVEQLRLAEEEHSRLMAYITELEQKQDLHNDGGSSGTGTGTDNDHDTNATFLTAENQRLIDELTAAQTELGRMEERIQVLEEREERYAEEIETLTVTLEDMERHKKLVEQDKNHHRGFGSGGFESGGYGDERESGIEGSGYENALLPSVKGGGEMIWMDALSEAGELKKENQRLHEEVEHLSAALMDAQLTRDVRKRRMQRTDSQSDGDEVEDDEDSDDSETSTHNGKRSSSQLTAQVQELENLVASLKASNNQLAIRIEHLDDEAVLEHTKHEYQVTELLKAAGLYNKNGSNGLGGSGSGGNGAVGRGAKNDQWFDLFRSQMDDERMKICALKGCLLRFVSKLSKEEQETLLDAGIILEPSQSYLDGGAGTSEGHKQNFLSFLKHA